MEIIDLDDPNTDTVNDVVCTGAVQWKRKRRRLPVSLHSARSRTNNTQPNPQIRVNPTGKANVSITNTLTLLYSDMTQGQPLCTIDLTGSKAEVSVSHYQ